MFGSSGGGFGAFAGAKTAFGQPSTAPAASPFGQSFTSASSPFGQPSTSTSTPSPFAAAIAAAQRPAEQPAPQAPTEQKAKSPPAGSTTSPLASGFAGAPTSFGGTGFAFGSTSTASTTNSPFRPAAGSGSFSGIKTEGTSAFLNPKPLDTQNKPLTTFAGAGTTQTTAAAQSGATKAPAFGASTAFGQSSFGKPGQSAFGQSGFGQSAFGQSPFAKSPFATVTPAATTGPTTTTGGGGFSSFASGGGSGGFAALASKAEQAPSFLGSTKAKDPKPTVEEKDKPAGKTGSVFGSNANVSKPGFGGASLRDSSTKNEDDEEGSTQPKEKFPEEEMDKLEPVTKYEGPGLFPTLAKAPQDMRALGLGDSKAGPSKSAFGLVATHESALGSAAAAFSIQPAAPTSTPTTSQPKASVPVSAFGASPAPVSKKSEESTTPKGKGREESDEDEEGDEDEDEDESVLLEDDIDSYLREGDEVLESHTFDEDEEEYESDEGDDDDDDDKASLSEEGDEDEGEEDEDDEEGSDLPDDGDESADEEHGNEVSPPKAPVLASTTAKSSIPLYNPFGKPKAAASVTNTELSSTASKQIPDPSTSKDATPSTAASTSASTSILSSAPGLSRPQPVSHPVGQPITEAPKPKPRPASPKAAFGTWVVPPKPVAPTPDSNKIARPKTPPMLFGKSSATNQTAQPRQPEVKSTTPPPAPAPQKPVAVQPIQPKHPEVQAGIDRILYEYGVIMHIVCHQPLRE